MSVYLNHMKFYSIEIIFKETISLPFHLRLCQNLISQKCIITCGSETFIYWLSKWFNTYFQTWWSWLRMFQHCSVLLLDWPFLRRSFVLYWNYSAERATPDPGTMQMRTLHLPFSSPARQVSAAFCLTIQISVSLTCVMYIFCAEKDRFWDSNTCCHQPVELVKFAGPGPTQQN
jgi:hypothetical protein